MTSTLRPWSYGMLLDEPVGLLRQHARTLFLATALLTVPVSLTSAFLQRSQLPGLLGGIRETGGGPATTGTLVVLGAVLLLGLVTRPLVAGAVTAVGAAHRLQRRRLGVGTALAAAARRYWSLLGAHLLVRVVGGAGLAVAFPLLAATTTSGLDDGAAIALGVAGTAVLLLGLLWAVTVMPVFVAVTPAVMVEGCGPLRALRRSASLVRGRYWRTLLVALVTSFVYTLAGLLLAAVPVILLGLVAPDENWPALAAGSAVLTVLTLPATTLVALLLYLDARVRREGLDLRIATDALEADRHATR